MHNCVYTYLTYGQHMTSECQEMLTYGHTSEYMQKFFKTCLKIIFYFTVCQYIPLCFKCTHPMPNIPLANVSIYQRMSDIFHTLTYANMIRYCVTGP